MTIRKKIMFGLALMAAIGMILGSVGLLSSSMLTSMSKELHNLQNENVSVSGVLNAHYIWRHGLTEFVLAGTDFTGSLDPNTCALGKWSQSDIAKKIDDTEILSLLNRIRVPHDFIHNEARLVTQFMENGEQEAATEHLTKAILPRTQEVITLLSEMEQRYAVIIEEKSDEIESLGASMNLIIIVLIIIALAACVLMALLITKSVVKPLKPLVAFMTKAGTTGDITLSQDDIEIISKISSVKDEIGQTIASCAGFVNHVTEISKELSIIASNDISIDAEVLSDKDVLGISMKTMLANFNSLFGDINGSTQQVAEGSKQIADGSQSLAQGSTQQAAAVQELSASIAEIAQNTKENAAMAVRAADLANVIKGNAEKGSRQMDEMKEAVKEINQASQSISKVIKVIDNIAFQTNILALNAAVEAARAGQHGKGFAVVAEEVRNLATKSAEAAKDTGGLIANSVEKAELGSRIAGETAASLAEIVSGINDSSRIITEIARSSEAQTAGIVQINQGIDQVAQVIQQNSATAEQSAAASEEMSSQSDMLEELISQFKLKNGGGKRISRAGAKSKKRLDMPEKMGYNSNGGAAGYGKY